MSVTVQQNNRRQIWAGAIVVAVVSLAYVLLWWNRYLGLNLTGWFFFYGQQILKGEVPYRDFYLSIPPLHALETAGLIALFGNKIIVPQIVGLLQRVILSLVIYFWLLRVFNIKASLLGALVAIITFCGDITESVWFYNQDSVFWAVLAGFFASASLNNQTSKRVLATGLLSGICAGLSFLTKQTTGIGVSLVIPTIIGIVTWRSYGLRKTRNVLIPFLAGWLIPISITWGWLLKAGALNQYFTQVFINGPSSKGPLLEVLIRPLAETLSKKLLLMVAATAIGILILLGISWRSSFSDHKIRYGSSIHNFFISATVAPAGIIGGVLLSSFWLSHFYPHGLRFLRIPQLVAVYIAIYGSTAVTFYYAMRWWRRQLTGNEAQLWLLSAVSFAIAFMLSLSAAAWEPMVVPGLALIVALASRLGDDVSVARRMARWSRYGVWTACFGLILFATWFKLVVPFGWTTWEEPAVTKSTTVSSIPELQGFVLSPSTVDLVEKVTNLIRSYSSPNDTVFVFPNMPIFYVLSNRHPPTFAYNHWFDIAPDYVSVSDAHALLRAEPAVIVSFKLSEGDVKFYERAFRAGKPSGQRELISAIQRLTSKYVLVDTLLIRHSDQVVKVWAKEKSKLRS